MTDVSGSFQISSTRKGFLALLTAAALYGGAGIFIRILERELGPFSQIAFRGFTGLAFSLLLFRVKSETLRGLRPLGVPLLGYSVLFPISVAFFTLAVLHTTLNATLFAFMTGSLLLSFLLGKWAFGENATARVRAAQLLCLGGVLLYVSSDTAGSSLWGLFLGLLAGLFEGLTNFSRKYLGTRVPYRVLVSAQMFGVLAVGSVLALIAGEPIIIPSQEVSWVTGIAFGLSLVAVTSLCIYGFQRFDLHLGTIVLTAELFFATLFGWLCFSEVPTPLQIAGCTLLVAALVAVHTKNEDAGGTERSGKAAA